MNTKQKYSSIYIYIYFILHARKILNSTGGTPFKEHDILTKAQTSPVTPQGMNLVPAAKPILEFLKHTVAPPANTDLV